MTKEVTVEKETEKTETKDEDNEIQEILRECLRTLRSDLLKLNMAIDFNEDNQRKLTILINARYKIQQHMFYCISMLRDPKLQITTQSGRNRDFARLIETALIRENPAVAKMVEEANQENAGSASGEKAE